METIYSWPLLVGDIDLLKCANTMEARRIELSTSRSCGYILFFLRCVRSPWPSSAAVTRWLGTSQSSAPRLDSTADKSSIWWCCGWTRAARQVSWTGFARELPRAELRAISNCKLWRADKIRRGSSVREMLHSTLAIYQMLTWQKHLTNRVPWERADGLF